MSYIRGANNDGPLSQQHLADFARRGWIACPRFFSAAEMTEIARWIEEVRSIREQPGKHMVYYEDSLLENGKRVLQRIENFCPYHDSFDRMIRGGPLLSVVERLIGEPAVLFKEKINFKMPGGSGFEAHQDQQAGWSTYAPIFITALLSIDAGTMDNGCLELATSERCTSLIGREWEPLAAEEMIGVELQPVTTEPGDVLFFDSYVPHASKPNLTSEPRRILYLTYNRAADGDHRADYYKDKRASLPPDIERIPGVEYRFRV